MGKRSKKYKLIIAGSRTVKDMKILEAAIKFFEIKKEDVGEIISDDSFGISKIAEWYANNNNIKYKQFSIEWQNLNDQPLYIKENKNGKYNAAAPFVAAQKMIDYADKILIITDGDISSTKLITLVDTTKLEKMIYEV